MDSQNSKSMTNDSRCVFFNTDSEDNRCVSVSVNSVLAFELISSVANVNVLPLAHFFESLTIY